ncbi:MAG: thiol:disulfide interchange protein DsbA/DsbL [Gammaproteobacteria bacterium]|nr:thiol:disulfide interchange protein DsbA/DsbL [Gammaproteobacteria bacterium]MDH3534321.1 thiol:disulfide interchange protein DsbA/DsbL [Gammaproteobacteria bacterium]
MKKHWLTMLLAMTLVSGSAFAQMAFVEGTDYQAISPAVKTSQPDKVVVTEIFWYGCPHCFRFEPYVERWSAALPEGVVFEHVPSSLNPRWTEHARAYYAFKMMNALDRAHQALFDAIHIKRQRLTSLDTLAAFAAEIGLDEKLFRENYFSFPVETQIRKDIQKEKRYGHRGVPSVIVNGKYLVSASLAGSNERMIEIMNFLVAKELGQ